MFTLDHLQESLEIYRKNYNINNIFVDSLSVIKANRITDTGKFIVRLLLLLCGHESMMFTWDQVRNIALKDVFRMWFWKFLTEDPEVLYNKDHVDKLISLQNEQQIDVARAEPDLYYSLIRMQLILMKMLEKEKVVKNSHQDIVVVKKLDNSKNVRNLKLLGTKSKSI